MMEQCLKVLLLPYMMEGLCSTFFYFLVEYSS
jgi:hypothetical protein